MCKFSLKNSLVFLGFLWILFVIDSTFLQQRKTAASVMLRKMLLDLKSCRPNSVKADKTATVLNSFA